MTSATIYLIPGQGSDHRVFKHLSFPDNYAIQPITYVRPHKHENMKEYAARLAQQIDTSNGPFVLLGYSLGGMICTELADVLLPEKVIIISSAKSKFELPKSYTIQRNIPLHTLIPAQLIKSGAQILQPLVEPDRNKEKETFSSMLGNKDPLFLKRTVDMIVNWQRQTYSEKIIHIHGDSDNTLPIKNINCNYIIENGSHMMVLTMTEPINERIDELLLP